MMRPKANQLRADFVSGRREREITGKPPLLGIVSRIAVRHSGTADKNYRLWQHDPHHPSLRLRRLKGSPDRFTVRIGDHYRALGKLTGNTITWVWIGSHADYDRLVG